MTRQAILSRVAVVLCLGWALVQLVLMEGGPERPRPTPTPRPTPNPPAQLEQLHRFAHMDCSEFGDRLASTLFEYPGLDPGPKSSQATGYRGNDVGHIHDCSAIQIKRYAWSEYEHTFYVYVSNGESEGWVAIEQVNLR